MICSRLNLLTLILAICTLGCGGESSDKFKAARPKTTPVSGKVTLDGAPVEGATVTLHPTLGGNSATGMTDSSGQFKLMTFEKDDGAVPAEYKVSIRKLAASAAGPAPGPDDPGYDPNPKEEPPKHLLPEQYADFLKSGLSATISTEPKTDLNFDLKK